MAPNKRNNKCSEKHLTEKEERKIGWYNRIRIMHDERLPRAAMNRIEEGTKRRDERLLGSWMKWVKRNLTRRGLQEEGICYWEEWRKKYRNAM